MVDGLLDVSAIDPGNIQQVRDRDITIQRDRKFKTISHWYSRKYLFERNPCFDDIHQSGLGDCPLLVVLLAIIQKDTRIILKMMHDLHNGWVVVRLFQDNGQPRYYKIEKSYLKKKDNSITQHNAFWVYMLEKAIAIHNLRYNHRYTPLHLIHAHGDNSQAATNYWQATSGGTPQKYFKNLLGATCQHHIIEAARQGSTAENEFREMLGIRPRVALTGDQRRLLTDMFGHQNHVLSRRLINEYKINNVINAANLRRRNASNQNKIIRREQLHNYIDQCYPGVALSEIRQHTKDYFDDFFPGKRGTGLYTRHQLSLYQAIDTAINNNHMVVISSSSIMGHVGHYGGIGEFQVKGLLGPHGYQVESCVIRHPLRYLVIRHPWGNYGREYAANARGHLTAQVQAPDQGKFELELSDLTKRFAFLDICQ